MIFNSHRLQAREIRSFFFSQYFSDGLRVTLGVLLPSFILAQFGQLALGMSISLAAFCVSLADMPGPIVHRKNGMLTSTLLLSLTVCFITLVNTNAIFVALALAVLGFCYAMLCVYGDRATMIGTGALLVMVLSIDRQLSVEESLRLGLANLIGGLWYTGLSLCVYYIRPYRSIQQIMGQYVHALSNYLRLKANYYANEQPSEDHHHQLTLLLAEVNQHQDLARELLLKHQSVIKKSTLQGRVLLQVFIELVDLLDQSMLIDDDYIRQQNAVGENLISFGRPILLLADELVELSHCLIQDRLPRPNGDFKDDLAAIRLTIDHFERERQSSVWGLRKVLISLNAMNTQMEKIYGYFSRSNRAVTPSYTQAALMQFAKHHPIELRVLRANFHLSSPAFRFSLRISISFLIGYLISQTFEFGHHSYWILMTTLLILKPTFSLSNARNYNRLIGTITGGLMGILIIYFVHNTTALFIILSFCMLGAYSFLRLHYGVSMFFLTPYILILFHFLGERNFSIVGERMIDTLIGSVIALSANYWIFPNWGYFRLKKALKDVAKANYLYIQQVFAIMQGGKWDELAYKLMRKQLYLSTANLRGVVAHMFTEPKAQQAKLQDLQRLVLLNYKLSIHFASLIHQIRQMPKGKISDVHLQKANQAYQELYRVLLIFSPKTKASAPQEYVSVLESTGADHEQAQVLSEQLGLIFRRSKDLYEQSLKVGA